MVSHLQNTVSWGGALRFLLALGLVVGFSSASAETVLSSSASKTGLPATYTGLFETRPTWGTRQGNFSTENYYEFNWWPKANRRFSFGETFFTQPSTNKVQEMYAGDGYVRYQLKDIKKNDQTGLTVSTEFRANLPISSKSRDTGFITALRSTVIIAVPITSNARFEFRETPVVYLYTESGHESPIGAISHPIFENRVTLGPIISINERLVLTAFINFSLVKFRNYKADASHNNELFPDLSFTPELDWAATSSSYVGIAYRTEGLMVRDRAGMILNNNPGGGSLQLVFGLSF